MSAGGRTMAVEGIDLEALLAPISAEAPAGSDVRNDFSANSVYFKLRDARAEARAAERAADANPGSEGGVAEGWRGVRTLALKLLTEQAKDIEVAAWLTESLVRTNGLAGLGVGSRLIAGLAERYWDNVFPLPDEDGMPTRVAPVTGLNGEGGDGTLIQPLLKLPVMTGPSGEPALLFQYEASEELAGIADPKRVESRIKAGVVPFDKMEAAARATNPGFYNGLRVGLNDALEAWNLLEQTFDRLAGGDAPPTRRVREVLEKIAGVLDRYAPVRAAGEAEAVDAGAVAAPVAGAAPAGPAPPKKLATREDALSMLGEIAEFFRRTEPHSPLAFMLEEAVRRGKLNWKELMADIIADEGQRNIISNALGIKPVK